MKSICILLLICGCCAVVQGQQTTPRKIAFVYGTGGSSTIKLINEDASGLVQLTPDGYSDRSPSWSPDGTQIALQSNRFGGTDNIYRMNADGTGMVPLTSSQFPSSNTDPAWSPDGTRILFVSNQGSERRREIWIMNAGGSDLMKLTTNVQLGSDSQGAVYSQDLSPAWSPDGAKIVFSSTRDGLANPEIYLMNADGTNQVRLTNSLAEDRDPVWSRDGLRITYRSSGAGRSGIYEINVDGSDDHRLTGSGSEPDWSPDGEKVALTDVDPMTSFFAIYLMNSDGSNRIRLTNTGNVDAYFPVWQTVGGPAPPPPPAGPLFTVAGRVVDTSLFPTSPGVPGVMITLSGTTSGVAITDSNGNFSFGNLPENGDFVLTPSNPDWGLYPASRSFSTNPPYIGFVGRTLTVQFDASPIFEQFITSPYIGTEGSSVIVTVERVGFLNGTSTINYASSDGTAMAGEDYTPTSGTLRFNPGESLKSFTIALIYDKKLEADESINLTLMNPTGSTARGRQTAIVNISDPFPLLITQQNPALAAALNSETEVAGPFARTTNFLSHDHATRIALFAEFVDLVPGENVDAVVVTAIDALQTSYNLPVEFVGTVPGLDWMNQINAIIPSNLPSGDLQVRITFRGKGSNLARITIR